jgi:hypothetical protein
MALKGAVKQGWLEGGGGRGRGREGSGCGKRLSHTHMHARTHACTLTHTHTCVLFLSPPFRPHTSADVHSTIAQRGWAAVLTYMGGGSNRERERERERELVREDTSVTQVLRRGFRCWWWLCLGVRNRGTGEGIRADAGSGIVVGKHVDGFGIRIRSGQDCRHYSHRPTARHGGLGRVVK